jgi:hypothetical protein
MTLSDFITKTFKGNEYNLRPRITCFDGFNLSIQGNIGAYCSPRKDSDFYSSMEIGFPSEKEELIMSYAGSEDQPTETVYGWVPIEVIEQVIEKHGGIDVDATFKQ